jgi:hypothetical protein
MKKKLLICLLTFCLVLVWSMVIADDFYVIPVKKRNWAPAQKTGQTKCYDASGTEISCSSEGQPNGSDLVKKCELYDFNKADIGLQNERSWSSALRAANSLASPYCGLSDGSSVGDWRLPNLRELQSIVHYDVYTPSVPNTAGKGRWTEGDPFTGVQPWYYWSSTTFAPYHTDAWTVILSVGVLQIQGKDNAHHV